MKKSVLTSLIENLDNKEDPKVAIYAAISLRELGDREAIPYLVDKALGKFDDGETLWYPFLPPMSGFKTEHRIEGESNIRQLRHESAVSACALGYEPQTESEVEVFRRYIGIESYYMKVVTYNVTTREVEHNHIIPLYLIKNQVGRVGSWYYYNNRW